VRKSWKKKFHPWKKNANCYFQGSSGPHNESHFLRVSESTVQNGNAGTVIRAADTAPGKVFSLLIQKSVITRYFYNGILDDA
jgi:hypothetical protein